MALVVQEIRLDEFFLLAFLSMNKRGMMKGFEIKTGMGKVGVEFLFSLCLNTRRDIQ